MSAPTEVDLAGKQPMIVVAQRYAARGWRVLPLHHVVDGHCSCGNPKAIADHNYRQGGKHPVHNSWQNDASTDWAVVAERWRSRPNANIGIATGEASGTFVLDVDPDSGGLDSLTALEAEHGPLPRTWRVETGSGGLHFYFAWPGFNPRNSAGKLGAGLDIRAEGGQVVAPPSVSVKGPYTVRDNTDPAPAPEWLVDMLRPPPPPPPVQPGAFRVDASHLAVYTQKALRAECEAIVTALDSTQNDTINRAAFNVGTLVGAGALTEGEAREALLSAALAGNHPEGRARPSIASGITAGMAQPRTPWPPISRRVDDTAELHALIAPVDLPQVDWPETEEAPDEPEASSKGTADDPAEPSVRRLVLTPASRIRIKPVRWLWDTTPENAPPTSHGRLPLNSLGIAAGGPGLGKSQFAVWMTARVTTGTLPGQLWGKPRGVIYAATEDSWSYTIAPRLVAAGADMERVFRVDVKDDEELHARLTLPKDISLMGKAAEEYSVALLVADPLLSMIDSTINDYRAAEVRSALEPLVAAADKHSFTILGLAHFTKAGGADPLARVAGSGAFGQLIRCLIAFAKQEDEEGNEEFVMSLEKNNLGRLGLPSYSYTIAPVTVDTDEGPSYVSRFVIGPESTTSVREVMRTEGQGEERGAVGEASIWLKDYLNDVGGSDKMQEIKKLARGAGFSESAVDRAKLKLKLKSRQQGFGKEKAAHWFLPEAWSEGDASA